MGSLKKQPPKALAWRHTLTHAAATEGVLVGWMQSSQEESGATGPTRSEGSGLGE